MYFVYILWSDHKQQKYVGLSSNPSKRLSEHNTGKTKSTKSGIPWKILYIERFDTRVDARKREKYFKTAAGRRFLKIKLTMLNL
jgi:putative endonuclease